MNNESIITKAKIETEEVMKHICHINHVTVKTEDSDEDVKIFSYYPDELTFHADELIGLTIREANELKLKRDVAYLQS